MELAGQNMFFELKGGVVAKYLAPLWLVGLLASAVDTRAQAQNCPAIGYCVLFSQQSMQPLPIIPCVPGSGSVSPPNCNFLYSAIPGYVYPTDSLFMDVQQQNKYINNGANPLPPFLYPNNWETLRYTGLTGLSNAAPNYQEGAFQASVSPISTGEMVSSSGINSVGAYLSSLDINPPPLTKMMIAPSIILSPTDTPPYGKTIFGTKNGQSGLLEVALSFWPVLAIDKQTGDPPDPPDYYETDSGTCTTYAGFDLKFQNNVKGQRNIFVIYSVVLFHNVPGGVINVQPQYKVFVPGGGNPNVLYEATIEIDPSQAQTESPYLTAISGVTMFAPLPDAPPATPFDYKVNYSQFANILSEISKHREFVPPLNDVNPTDYNLVQFHLNAELNFGACPQHNVQLGWNMSNLTLNWWPQ